MKSTSGETLANMTTAPRSSTARPAAPKVSSTDWRVFIGVTLGAFIALLDVSIVTVALPSMGKDLHTTTSGLQWVVDAYTLVLSALLLSAGSLGDRFGRRRLYVGGLGLFVVASACCAAAPNIGVLIAARAVEGGAGALVFTGGLSLLVQAFPDDAVRAKMIGLNGAIGGSGVLLGPVLSGVLVNYADWRTIFLVNLPIGIIAIWLILRSIPESSDPEHASIDVPGQLVGLLFLATLTYGLIASSEHGWSSPVTITPLAVAVLALAGFIVVEGRVAHPVLPIGLFADRRLSIPNVASLVLGFGTSAAFFLLSLYLQDAQGRSAISTGLRFLPMTVAICLFAGAAGKAAGRRGPFVVMVVGYLVSGVALLGLALFDVHTGLGVFIAVTVVLGVGMGLSIPPTQAAGVMALPRQRSGLASAVISTSRQTGTTLGIAVLGLLVSQAAVGRLGTADYAHGFVHGLHQAGYVAGGATIAAALLIAVLVPRRGAAPTPAVAPSRSEL